jgi:hypothetical protein
MILDSLPARFYLALHDSSDFTLRGTRRKKICDELSLIFGLLLLSSHRLPHSPYSISSILSLEERNKKRRGLFQSSATHSNAPLQVSYMLLDLPEDALRHVALFLVAPDVLRFLSAHPLIHHTLGTSEVLWRLLLERDSYCNDLLSTTTTTTTAVSLAPEEDDSAVPHVVVANTTSGTAGTDSAGSVVNATTPSMRRSVQELRRLYMTKAYINHLPAVQWHPIRNQFQAGLSPREGHLACVLGSGQNRKICINGGFTDDDAVYVLHAPTASSSYSSSSSSSSPSIPTRWTWDRIIPHMGDDMVGFVYGSTLTAIDDRRAVRFGGFRAGGYSHETNQVALLTLTETELTSAMAKGTKVLQFSYDAIPTTNASLGTARAYHTATLVAQRYLVILGGMMWRGSFLKEAILDTNTWTWLEHDITTIGTSTTSTTTTTTTTTSTTTKPSGRHGHSVVVDERRNRLVLFGGGNGSNLLRSGVDNSEVWELQMGDDGAWKTNLPASLPWKWRPLHADIVNPVRQARSTTARRNDCSSSSSSSSEDDSATSATTTRPTLSSSSVPLSRAEALCLGRCHNSVCVSPDTVLFVLGSGRPSTNGVLAYDLSLDQFVRPRVRGPLPKPRHSGVAAYLEDEGYLLVHGGYTVRDGDAIGDMSILDLAPDAAQLQDQQQQRPGLNRLLPLDLNYQSNGVVTNEDAIGDGYRGRQMMDIGMLVSMLNQPASSEGQPDFAQAIRMMNGGRTVAEFAAAAAANQFDSGDDGDWNEDDDDDDDDDDNDEEMDDSDYQPLGD